VQGVEQPRDAELGLQARYEVEALVGRGRERRDQLVATHLAGDLAGEARARRPRPRVAPEDREALADEPVGSCSGDILAASAPSIVSVSPVITGWLSCWNSALTAISKSSPGRT